MKKAINLSGMFIFSGLLVFTSACTKDDHPSGTASLTMIDVVTGTSALVANFDSRRPLERYADASMIMYGVYSNNVESQQNNQFNAYNGMVHLALFNYPDTLAQSQPLFNLSLNMPAGSIHSLFLTGTVTAPDTMFTIDHPPYHPPQDSSMSVRFVNLSPGSGPVSVNLQGQTSGSEAVSLPYKGITGFKNYAVVPTVSKYVFEFRNASDGTLLATYSAEGIDQAGNDNFPDRWSRRNFTLAFYGLPSNQVVLCINNN